MPRALITGISGQDGAYLAKLLLDKGYEVYGAQRRNASSEHWRLQELGILDQIKMVTFELLEWSNIVRTLEKVRPDEIYNLAAMSFVGASFELPVYTGDTNGLGVVRILEAMRQVCPKAKFYQASTSEMFGAACSSEGFGKREYFQDESTPFSPRSPYGCAKLYAHSMVVNYREAYDMYCCSGILFNHESPLRGEEFVTRKITSSLARWYRGEQDVLELGNMSARRDWGHAEDYVRGMWMMLQQDEPDDYVLATGETRSVKDFVDAAIKALDADRVAEGLEPECAVEWEGEGIDTVARLKKTIYGVQRRKGEVVVRVNPEFFRPSDVEYLCGCATKAKEKLGWEREYSFEELVASMVEHDLEM